MLVYISALPRITMANSDMGPYAVIMAPTRELAQQISEECDKFGTLLGIKNVCIVGGVPIEEQGNKLRDGAEVIIGTPGRLYDCIEKRYLVLYQCNYVVLDEADRMIDMNFEPQIMKVLDSMPSTNLRPENPDDEKSDHHYRQTIMFSATMPVKVEMLSKKYLRNPVFIAIGDRKGKVSANVEQRFQWFTNENEKRAALIDVVSNESPPIIVFCNQKKTCDTVSRILESINVSNVILHGGKMQEVREAALQAFKDGKIDVLIGTDVLGRGIDVTGVSHVINFEMPGDIQKYTHRIGRTGRAGKKGTATSFVMESDNEIFYDLKELVKGSNVSLPPQLANHDAAKFKPGSAEANSRKPKIQYAKDTL